MDHNSRNEPGKLVRLYHPMNLPEIPRRDNRKFILGRVTTSSASNGPSDFIVCSSEYVSRNHCEVFFRNGAYWIKDMKSLNGTFLNGQRLIPNVERELRVNDYIGLGVVHNAPEVEEPAYFVFQFKVHHYEVIDIDEEQDDVVSNISEHQDGEDENLDDSDDSEVEIVEENIRPAKPAALKPPVALPQICRWPSDGSNSDIESRCWRTTNRTPVEAKPSTSRIINENDESKKKSDSIPPLKKGEAPEKKTDQTPNLTKDEALTKNEVKVPVKMEKDIKPEKSFQVNKQENTDPNEGKNNMNAADKSVLQSNNNGAVTRPGPQSFKSKINEIQQKKAEKLSFKTSKPDKPQTNSINTTATSLKLSEVPVADTSVKKRKAATDSIPMSSKKSHVSGDPPYPSDSQTKNKIKISSTAVVNDSESSKRVDSIPISSRQATPQQQCSKNRPESSASYHSGSRQSTSNSGSGARILNNHMHHTSDTSADDSSDGMSDSLRSLNDRKNLPSSSSKDKGKSSSDKIDKSTAAKHMSETEVSRPTSTPEFGSKFSLTNKTKSVNANNVTSNHTPHRSNTVNSLPNSKIKLRHVMAKKFGTVAIRQSILRRFPLTDVNRKKIQRQWKYSRRMCRKSHNESTVSEEKSSSTKSDASDSNSDSSDELLAPITSSRKNHRSSKSGADNKNRREKVWTRIAHGDTSSDSEVSSRRHSKSKSKSPIRNSHQKGKKPVYEEQKYKSSIHKQAGFSKTSSPDMFSPKNPRAMSPISDREMDVEGDNDKLSEVSDVSIEEEAPDHHPAAHGSRKMILLDSPPTPYSQQKKQNAALCRAKMDVNKPYCRPITNVRPPVNKSIKEQLKSIAQKQSGVEITRKEIEICPRTAPIATKVTKQNRNDSLFASLIYEQKQGSVQDQVSPLMRATTDRIKSNSGSTTTAPSSNKPVIAPKREIPPEIPLITHLESKITAAMQAQPSSSKKTDKTAMPPPSIPTASVVPSHRSTSRNMMQKPGVAHSIHIETQARYQQDRIFDYGHNSAVPTVPKKHSARHAPVITDDEVYKIILRWRPNWLEEQLNQKLPPPVTSDREICRTLYEYKDYKSYVEILFPLVLLEIWAIITQDFFNKNRKAHGSTLPPITEYPISIDGVSKCADCPMLNSKFQQGGADSFWTQIHCHAAVSNQKDIVSKRDFVIVKVGIRHKNGTETGPKDVFGFVLSDSEVWSSITSASLSSVNSKLTQSCTQVKHKHNCVVVIYLHPGEEIDLSFIGSIKRVSYIGPRLRDVKSINQLRISRLFDHVINPKTPSILWDPFETVSQHRLVKQASKLNQIQKSAVAYVDAAVKRDEPNLLLLHGPPGTGKTRTIVGMILQILLNKDRPVRDRRILVCTPSNTAIDEIMMRLQAAIRELPQPTKETDGIQMVRIGDSDGPMAKKYSLEVLAQQYGERGSLAANIRNNISQCEKERKEKEALVLDARRKKQTKTIIDSYENDIVEITLRIQDYKADLSKKVHPKDKSEFGAWRKIVLESANVVCSTLSSCTSHMITRAFGYKSKHTKPFLCCIVDEASQTTEPETLNPLLLQVDKLILVGDPNQLGATVLSNEAENKDFGLSLFARLHHVFTSIKQSPHSVMTLTQQYRMHPEILQFPNECFYKGMLKTQCIGRSEQITCPLRPYLFLNLSSKESSNREGKISNEQEAKMVIEIIRNIHLVTTQEKENQRKWSIGVITPYLSQKQNIITNLNRELHAISSQVEVSTVDGFQGKEKDIVIISCVRTDDTGFLKNRKRLNVALTRARHSLLVIGDAVCLRKEPMWKSLIENAAERNCLENIPTDEWSNFSFLRKKLFSVMSPKKSQLPNR